VSKSPHNGGNPGPPAPRQPPSKDSDIEILKSLAPSRDELVKLALELYDAGFNVTPVGPWTEEDWRKRNFKRPLVKTWGYDRRVQREELERLPASTTGLAIVGGPENPWRGEYWLILIDIDRPSVVDRSPTLRDLCRMHVCWMTGPRCPSCEGKDLEVVEFGRTFRCVKCNLAFTAEEARRGFGTMILVDREVGEKLGQTLRLGDVELLVKNYQLIPPSLHPSGLRYAWVNRLDPSKPFYGIRYMLESELRALAKELGFELPIAKAEVEKAVKAGAGEARVEAKPVKGARGAGIPASDLRELQTHDILEIVDALLPAYRPGVRQYLWLFLSGWAAKAKISPVSIAKVLKALYDKTGDADSLKTRASAIVYSYRKAGISLEPYAKELEEILGVKPYGLESEIREEEVKGKSGLQEILEETLGEERALDVLRLIEERFGVASPFKGDSIVEILDYERQLYAVANLRSLVVVRAVRRDGRLVYREKIFDGAPVRVIVYEAPGGRASETERGRLTETIPARYQVVWRTKARDNPIVIGPDTIDGVVERLKVEGLVYHPNLALGVLSAILNVFVKRGRAEVKVEIDRPGFYVVDVVDQEKGVTARRLVAVDYKIEMPEKYELRESLLFLDELAMVWFKPVLDRFSTAIKWWVLAPFSYAIKQFGTYMPGLYHYGPPNTRKTTINIVGMSIWSYNYHEIASEEKEIPGAAVNTQPRLGYWISRGTFPICIREPGGIFEDQNMLDMIKSAVEGLMARGRHVSHRTYEWIPALAALCFTSNTYIPRDPSLPGKRLYILTYGYSEALKPDSRREDKELMERFDTEVKPKLGKLRAIGKFIASKIAENPEILREASWVGDRWLQVAESLLKEAYRWAGLDAPEWLNLNYRSEGVTSVYEDVREKVRVFLVERINDEYNKAVGRVIVVESEGGGAREKEYWRYELPLEERIKLALKQMLIPWLILRGEKVYITTGILDELRRAVGDVVGNLRNLAELLGWEYDDKHSIRMGKIVKNLSVIIVPLEEFIDFLARWEEDRGAEGRPP